MIEAVFVAVAASSSRSTNQISLTWRVFEACRMICPRFEAAA